MAAGALNAGGSNAAVQVKNNLAGNTDHFSAGENLVAWGYGAVGGKLLGGATKATPAAYKPWVRDLGRTVWRNYNPAGMFHNLLP